MRPVSTAFRVSQPFGSMKTAGVAPSTTPGTVGYYVYLYGNYQPYGHAGMDFACPEGTPVYAIADGTVLWADWGTNLPGDETNAGYRKRWYLYKKFPGIVTIIQHRGWVGVYAHLSKAPLSPGNKVTEGQVIALSGGTGGVAPHLHVEALVDLNYPTSGGLIYGRTNPEPFFGSAAIAPQGATITPAQIIEEIDVAAEERIIAAINQETTWAHERFTVLKAQNAFLLQIVANLDSSFRFIKINGGDESLYEVAGGVARGISLAEWTAKGGLEPRYVDQWVLDGLTPKPEQK